jgi:hypothetical protein
MVCEEEHLSLLRELAEHLKSSMGSIVVKVDEQVVGHEGQGSGVAEVVFDGREPQRQIELIRRARADA